MTDINRPPLATGGMSPEGTTTIVKINRPDLDPQDKKVLCSAMCQCKDTPETGKNGQSLRQMCVSGRLAALDNLLEHRSPYKTEQAYDMLATPPAPIMSPSKETKTHPFWQRWLTSEQRPSDYPRHVPGTGMVRKPDVVIVNDPTKPPTQDNIKQIVEMKFPPDKEDKDQTDDYGRIAGNPTKVRVLKPDDCDCDKAEPNSPKIPVEKMGWAAAVASLFMFIGTRGKTPVPVIP